MPLVFRGPLSAFFPPGEPRAEWLYRLAILREDLGLEVRHIGLNENSTEDDVAETLYFLRRIAGTLLEATNIFAHEVPMAIAESPEQYPPEDWRIFDGVRRRLEELKPVFEGVRNGIGAHVRPKHATGDPASVARMVGIFSSTEVVKVQVDTERPERTALRAIGTTAFHSVWADVHDDETYSAKHEEYGDALREASTLVMRGIDHLLLAHWRGNPVMAVSELDD